MKWQFRRIRFVWVPREQNEEADTLSVAAYVEVQEKKRRDCVAAVTLEKREPSRFLTNGKYLVNTEVGACTCPDFRRRHTVRFSIRCKHLLTTLTA